MTKLKSIYLIEWNCVQTTHSMGTLVAFATSKKEADQYIKSRPVPSEYTIIIVDRCD